MSALPATETRPVGRAERVREAQRLRRRGLTVPQIAAELGVSESSARSYVHDPDLVKQKRRRAIRRNRLRLAQEPRPKPKPDHEIDGLIRELQPPLDETTVVSTALRNSGCTVRVHAHHAVHLAALRCGYGDLEPAVAAAIANGNLLPSARERLPIPAHRGGYVDLGDALVTVEIVHWLTGLADVTRQPDQFQRRNLRHRGLR